jgi:hypothetical protein
MKRCLGCRKDYPDVLDRCPACGRTDWALAPGSAFDEDLEGSDRESLPPGVWIIIALLVLESLSSLLSVASPWIDLPTGYRVMSLVLCLPHILLAIGLWLLHPLAWCVALPLFGSELVATFFLVKDCGPLWIRAGLLSIFFIYLLLPGVRDRFLSRD